MLEVSTQLNDGVGDTRSLDSGKLCCETTNRGLCTRRLNSSCIFPNLPPQAFGNTIEEYIDAGMPFPMSTRHGDDTGLPIGEGTGDGSGVHPGDGNGVHAGDGSGVCPGDGTGDGIGVLPADDGTESESTRLTRNLLFGGLGHAAGGLNNDGFMMPDSGARGSPKPSTAFLVSPPGNKMVGVDGPEFGSLRLIRFLLSDGILIGVEWYRGLWAV